MQLAILEARIDELVSDLASYNGHRTLWLDDRAELVHAEPDEMLETRGFRYIATMFQPDREDLTAAVLMIVPVELDEPVRRAMAHWEAPATAIPAFA